MNARSYVMLSAAITGSSMSTSEIGHLNCSLTASSEMPSASSRSLSSAAFFGATLLASGSVDPPVRRRSAAAAMQARTCAAAPALASIAVRVFPSFQHN